MTTTRQLATFYLGQDLYGIEVMRVQEVTGKLQSAEIPRAPSFVRGLINLRGQIATALDLKRMFFPDNPADSGDSHSVVCNLGGNLVSLLVDSIGEVVEVTDRQFERAPDTMPAGSRKYIQGVYKTEAALLCLLNLDTLTKELSHSVDSTDLN